MQSHYEKLNWNNADKWILGFENSISYFATNVGRIFEYNPSKLF
jgi:hypothetical protein